MAWSASNARMIEITPVPGMSPVEEEFGTTSSILSSLAVSIFVLGFAAKGDITSCPKQNLRKASLLTHDLFSPSTSGDFSTPRRFTSLQASRQVR
ncbi:MFS general substrate transporter [Penicillium brevicompactum]|uniref:MFS general substrate transporter n=1 Tax=Penicillium brevicompactum TaxID=5074 RepID=UPI0025417F24|nr:MFS general substrate transporter [Penicillium brevicompactum]KAJ5348524.1 MFS general substrate transporter [Penicillium brevicompactum]